MFTTSEDSLSYEQELFQKIRVLNDEIAHTEHKIKLEIRELTAIKSEHATMKRKKSSNSQKLREISADLSAKRQKWQTLNEAIKQFESVTTDINKEICANKTEMDRIESAMTKRSKEQMQALINFGKALSLMNEKLYYSNLTNLFENESPHFIQTQIIENSTQKALQIMKCPNNLAMQKIDKFRLKTDYSKKSNSNSNNSGEAMDIDKKENGNEISELKSETEKVISELKSENEKNEKFKEIFAEKTAKLSEMRGQKQQMQNGKKEIESELDWIVDKILPNTEKFMTKMNELSETQPNEFGNDNNKMPYIATEASIARVKSWAQMCKNNYAKAKNIQSQMSFEKLAKEFEEQCNDE